MALTRGLGPLLILATATLSLSACQPFRQTVDMFRGQLVAPAIAPPEYAPGFEYLPLKSNDGPAWMVRAYEDRRSSATTTVPVRVWYAQPNLMVRTENGRVTTARGFRRQLLRLDAGQCPDVTSYSRLTAPVTCELRRDLDVAFGLRETIRIDPPRLLADGWEGMPGPLLLVREKVLAGEHVPGNYYVYSPSGELLRSRQWLARDFWLELSAVETAGGKVMTPATPVQLPAATPATAVAEPEVSGPDAPVEAEAPAAVPAPVAMPSVSGPADPVDELQPEPVPEQVVEPTPAPATPAPVAAPGERAVPGQPPGFVRKVK